MITQSKYVSNTQAKVKADWSYMVADRTEGYKMIPLGLKSLQQAVSTTQRNTSMTQVMDEWCIWLIDWLIDWLKILLEICIGKGTVSWQYSSLVQGQLKG